MFRQYFQRLVNRSYEKTGFTGYVYDYSADYSTVTVDDIKDIHNCLTNKNNIV